MNLIVSPEYVSLKDFLERIPTLFAKGEGRLLWQGRNAIRSFEHGGVTMVAKHFKPLNMPKKCFYTLFRKNKALRSFENAGRLRSLGIDTPHEIAYIEIRRGRWISDVYYVCAYSDYRPLVERLTPDEDFDPLFTTDFAAFVAQLHEQGIIHHDLNNTNVTFRHAGSHYEFSLIDINRMTFYAHPAPLRESLHNLTLFSDDCPQFRFFVRAYARQRHLPDAAYDDALRIKALHDRRWKRRKRLLHPCRKR